MQLAASLAAFAAAITSVNALGNAIIKNQCNFPVYLWAVDAQRNPSSPSTIAAGGTYSEGFHTPTSGGVSLKLSTTTSNTLCTQFEYTVQSYLSDPFVWYDGSNVNCAGSDCPFYAYGMELATSISSCPTRNCPVDEVCTGFYTVYNDDVNSLSCADTADITLTLCSASQGSSGGYSAGSSAAAVSPAAAKTSAVAVSSKPATTTKAVILNEAVITTLITEYASPSKRAEPVHHNHMHFHQHVQES